MLFPMARHTLYIGDAIIAPNHRNKSKVLTWPLWKWRLRVNLYGVRTQVRDPQSGMRFSFVTLKSTLFTRAVCVNWIECLHSLGFWGDKDGLSWVCSWWMNSTSCLLAWDVCWIWEHGIPSISSSGDSAYFLSLGDCFFCPLVRPVLPTSVVDTVFPFFFSVSLYISCMNTLGSPMKSENISQNNIFSSHMTKKC